MGRVYGPGAASTVRALAPIVARMIPAPHMAGTEVALSIALGVGLAAAVGFRVFLPMLVLSVAAYSGHLHPEQQVSPGSVRRRRS